MTPDTQPKRLADFPAAVCAGTLGFQEEHLKLALDAGRIGVWNLAPHTGNLVVSDLCAKQFGRHCGTELATSAKLLATLHPADRARIRCAFERSMASRNGLDVLCRSVWPDGSLHWIHMTGRVVAASPVHMVGISRDVTVEQRIEEDRKRLQDRMAYIAYHDPLTGLENRFGLGACLRQAASQSVPFALLYLDLNQFKHVNDTMGHQAGDVLLRHVARRLETCIRDKDTVARHGGDEFVVIQMGADCERDAAHLAQRVIAGVGEPCGIHGHIVKIGVSIGITLVTDHSRHADEILKDADIALYRAKHAGRGCYCFSNADHPNGTNHLKWADFGMNREKTEAEPFWNREKGQSTKSS